MSAKAIPAVTGVNHDHVILIVTFGQCAPQSLDVQRESDLEISKVIIFLFDQGKGPKVKLVMIVMIIVYTLKGKLFRNTGIVISEQSNMHDMSAYHQHSYLSRRQSLIPRYYNLSIKIIIFV